MFAVINGERDLDELKSLLLDFFHKKLDEETDRLWANRQLSAEAIEAMMQGHDRTGGQE
jgi:hypothetical protein